MIDKPLDQITLRDLFYECDNITERRDLIKKLGWERIVKMYGDDCKIQQKTKQGTLYSIYLPEDPDSFMKIVRVNCPSTGSIYYLRVPPHIVDVKTAIAWTFGLEPEAYNPIKET